MSTSFQKFIAVLSAISDEDEMASFLREMLTSKEIADVALRWQLLEELYAGETQRSIAARHKLSLCKITRGARILKNENSITKKILRKKWQKKGRQYER